MRSSSCGHENVAFALIKPTASTADGVARIRREAQAMGRLGDHPHIVTVFDAGEEPSAGSGQSAPFIVYQHMQGGAIEDLLAMTEHRRVATERAMQIGERVQRQRYVEELRRRVGDPRGRGQNGQREQPAGSRTTSPRPPQPVPPPNAALPRPALLFDNRRAGSRWGGDA